MGKGEAVLRGANEPRAFVARGTRVGREDVQLIVEAEDREGRGIGRSEEHTSELQSLMRISYAVFCLKKKKKIQKLREHQLLQCRQQKCKTPHKVSQA